MDTSISIIQYLKNGTISANTEISNVRANLDVNIRVRQFLMNSIDYQALDQEIINKGDQLSKEDSPNRKLHLSNELNLLLKLKKEFIIDVLELADVFSRMDIRTERLKKAKKLFDQGKFKEADASLIESELSNEQFNLLIQVEYLEKRRDQFLGHEPSSKNNL